MYAPRLLATLHAKMHQPANVNDKRSHLGALTLIKLLVAHARAPGASICFQHCEDPKSLPSPPVTSPFFPFASLPLLSFSPPLKSNPARGSVERCKHPQWGLGRSPSRQRFLCILRVKKRCWWQSRCTVLNNRKRLYLTFL